MAHTQSKRHGGPGISAVTVQRKSKVSAVSTKRIKAGQKSAAARSLMAQHASYFQAPQESAPNFTIVTLFDYSIPSGISNHS